MGDEYHGTIVLMSDEYWLVEEEALVLLFQGPPKDSCAIYHDALRNLVVQTGRLSSSSEKRRLDIFLPLANAAEAFLTTPLNGCLVLSCLVP